MNVNKTMIMIMIMILLLTSGVAQNLYECNYAGLSCGCYSNNQGGCQVSCSPAIYFKTYNQTECATKDNFILAGFINM